MAMKSWTPLVAAMALATGLAGCGNGDDEPAPAEAEEVQEETTQQAAEADESPTDEEAESTQEDSPADAAQNTVESESDVDLEADADAQADVDVEAETLGGSPDDTLGEDAALPGETTRSDVDAIIEETERRFEEASRRIDEQFESADEEAIQLEPMEASPEFEPMETPSYESDIDLDATSGSDLDEGETLPGESTSSDIEAIIEENEKRFEEASRQIDEQFEEAERQAPGTSSDLDSLEGNDMDGETGGAGN